jgi:hypothetical protein
MVLNAVGMPVWEVSEPYINVWLYDLPISYRPGVGYGIAFKLAYKQRESRNISTNFFSLGNMLDCSWLSYITDDPNNSQGIMHKALLRSEDRPD